MLELGMIVSLALMGIYFYKSADLPQELKDRSAQMQAQHGSTQAFKPKMTFPKVEVNASDLDTKLIAMKQQKKLKDIVLLNAEIDRLTMEITTLEQQIKVNNARNAEIQKTIDTHLIALQELQAQIIALS